MNKFPDSKNCQRCQASPFCLPTGIAFNEIEQLHHLVKKQKKVNKGETLIKSGQRFDYLYIANRGALKSILPSKDGSEQIVNFHFIGELIGLDGVDSGQHQFSVIALQPAQLCAITHEQLLNLAMLMPSLQRHLFKLMSMNFNQKFSLAANSTARQRLALALIHIASRLSGDATCTTALNLPMSRQELANYLGLAMETVSRLLSDFKQEGLINISGKQLTIADHSTLKMVANLI